MRKLLLSSLFLSLLNLSGEAQAADVTTYTVDETTEITSLADITDGTPFVMTLDGKAMCFTDAQNASMESYSVAFQSHAYGFQLEAIESENETINGKYLVRVLSDLTKSNYWALWGNTNNSYLNTASFVIFTMGLNGQYGQDAENYAVWDIQYVEGEGFTFYNVGLGGYMNGTGAANNSTPQYWKLYTGISSTTTTVADYSYTDNDANTSIFTTANAVGFDADTRALTTGWQFDGGVDISGYQYLVITTAQTAADYSRALSISDGTLTISGESYSGSSAGTGGNMWLDRWNNQNIIAISLKYCHETLGLDCENIKSLTYSGSTLYLGNIYLTNRAVSYGGYQTGDNYREYSTTGNFGTVCLPYTASVAGALIYSVASYDEENKSIILTQETGLLTAGRPYIFKSYDEIGADAAGSKRNVNFFRADLNDDVTTAGSNNGLVGSFTDNTEVTAGHYILQSNTWKLVAEGNTNYVNANRAYLDLSAVPTDGSVKGVNMSIEGNGQANGIESLTTEQVADMLNGEVYDLQGRRVSRPGRGLYIVGGKKLIVK